MNPSRFPLLLLGGLGLLCRWASIQRPYVTFEDVTKQSKIDFQANFSPTAEKFLVETMGGGVAAFDYNNDGWIDVFFTNGALVDPQTVARTGPIKNDPRFWNRLYRNNGDGTFTDVTALADLAGHGFAMGVAVGDFDNDGWEDLYVTNYGFNELYHNNGNGTFTDVASKMGVQAGGWSSSAGFVDCNGDGFLDLFVCRYLNWSFETNKVCRAGYLQQRSYCHPGEFPPISNLLFRNIGGKRFEDVSAFSGIVGVRGKALGVAFNDFDQDGKIDIAVANDQVPQILFRNLGDGKFENVAPLTGAAYDENGHTFAGMGIDFSDFDNDGAADLVITTLTLERYALYRNRRDGSFDYATNASGLGQISRLYAGWGIAFFDFDNDGWKDLAVAQGHVLDNVESVNPNLKYKQPPKLLWNRSSSFSDVSAACGFPQDPRAGRGLAIADFDNDGNPDLVIANLDGPPTLLRNRGGAANNWTTLKLVGRRSNHDAIGATIELTDTDGKKQFAMVSPTGSYLSAEDIRPHFGLGRAAGVKEISITWPSGRNQRIVSPPTRRVLRIEEPLDGLERNNLRKRN